MKPTKNRSRNKMPSLKFEHVKMIQLAFGIKGIMSAREVADTIIHEADKYSLLSGSTSITDNITMCCQWRAQQNINDLSLDCHEQVADFYKGFVKDAYRRERTLS